MKMALSYLIESLLPNKIYFQWAQLDIMGFLELYVLILILSLENVYNLVTFVVIFEIYILPAD